MHPGLGAGDSCRQALQHRLLPEPLCPPRRGSTEPKGLQPLLPTLCCFTVTSVHPHSPLLPTVPQSCQGIAGRLNTELGLPQAGFSITPSISYHMLATTGCKVLGQSCQLPGLPKVRTACIGKCCLWCTPTDLHIGNPRRTGNLSWALCL